MPRLSDTSVSKYRKHASGQARVVLNGKTVYLGKYGSKASRDKYNKLVGEWQANDRQLPVAKDETISVTHLCLEYLRFAKKYCVKNGKMTDEIAGVKAAMKQLHCLRVHLVFNVSIKINLSGVERLFLTTDFSI